MILHLLGVGWGDKIPGFLCCCWDVFIGSRWVGTPSWSKVTYADFNYFEPSWLVEISDVLWVIDSSHTNKYLNRTLLISWFAWSFCIPDSFLYFEARNSSYNALLSLGTGEWVNLCVIAFGYSNSYLASLSVCLLLFLSLDTVFW